MSIIQTAPSRAQRAGAAAFGGYGPSDLRKAYGLTAAAAQQGRGRTVAIVDAFSDPRAAADLARYRRLFDLPQCTVASGCLRIVNEHGGSHLPIPDKAWAIEESLDLDMVSAICPRCHILLVEASLPDITDLGTAVNTAVRMGARYVSGSWGGPELVGLNPFNRFFNHPGRAISFAAGDFGYGPGWPADLQYVTSVGGTSLRRSSGGRGFAESVWGSATGTEGTGSGCSAIEPKPSWQRVDATEPAGCLNRTMNDVAAVADPNTGVAVIDSYLRRRSRMILGGTSVATPIVTSVYALAGRPTPGTYPAEYPYLHAGHLFPVTSGANGQCEPDRQYLCTAEPGYDGPTGLGTPDGTGAFTDHGTHRVTLVDPGTVDAAIGQSVELRVIGLDTRTVSALQYSATGLPAGLSINAVPHSADAMITGTLTGPPGTFHVTVTAKDGTVTGTTNFLIVGVPSLTTAAATPGQVSAVGARIGVRCLDDSGGGTGAVVRIQACDSSAGQQWVYSSDGNPTDAGALTIDGLCLKPSSPLGQAVLAACNGHDGEHWQYLYNTSLLNVGTRTCLFGAGVGSAVKLRSCQSFTNPWQLPAVQIASGVGQLCVTASGTLHSPATVADCANSSGQQWTPTVFHYLVSASGLCLTAEGTLTGASVAVANCHAGVHGFPQLWLPFTGGQLINVAAMRCLSDPGAGGAGTALTLQDCYGEPGEVWGLN